MYVLGEAQQPHVLKSGVLRKLGVELGRLSSPKELEGMPNQESRAPLNSLVRGRSWEAAWHCGRPVSLATVFYVPCGGLSSLNAASPVQREHP